MSDPLPNTFDERWQESQRLQQPARSFIAEYSFEILILVALIGLGLLMFADRAGYTTNVYTEIISVVFTILFLDRRAQRREEARQREERIARIVRELRSPSAEEGARAADEAQEIGIMRDGTLSHASLAGANLSGADLTAANLSGVDLGFANLSNAVLQEINLSGANLWAVNLSNADLGNAHLRGIDLRDANLFNAHLYHSNLVGAHLETANLSKAFLRGANLSDANLRGTNLHGVDLTQAIFNNHTVLPDAQLVGVNEYNNFSFDKHWTPDTDMSRYTDPDHPDFWQPEWAKPPYDWHEPFPPAWYEAWADEQRRRDATPPDSET